MASRKYSVLIVSQSEKTVKALSGLFSSCDFSAVYSATNAGKARRMAFDLNIDFVIINTPLPDDYGIQLAMNLAENNLGVMLIVNNESYEQISYKVENYGVVTLSKPVSRTSFVQALKLLRAMKMKIEKLEARTQTLESKMKEIRLVNRAKWVLIERLKMSESDAHRYIEKAAMDECVSKGVIAENIIKMYEA